MLMFPPATVRFRVLLVFLALYALWLGILAMVLPTERLELIFSESGYFEMASIALWMLAGMVMAVQARTISGLLAPASMVCFLCAMREADWHKKFTYDGITKLKYFTQSPAPIAEKSIAALVVLLSVALLLRVIWIAGRRLRETDGFRDEKVWLVMLGGHLFVVGKILDRSLSVLTKSLDVVFSPNVKCLVSAYEEGLEMVTPLLFLLVCFWPSSQPVRCHA